MGRYCQTRRDEVCCMTLRAGDEQHFYIDAQLIDLVWIEHRVRKEINAANYHDRQRHLRWLHKLAGRLLAGHIEAQDEAAARRSLAALGFGWYFDKNSIKGETYE